MFFIYSKINSIKTIIILSVSSCIISDIIILSKQFEVLLLNTNVIFHNNVNNILSLNKAI